MNVFSRKVIPILSLALIALLPFAGYAEATETAITPLAVKILRIGRADGIVLRSGSQAMIIDTGEEEDGPEILEYLQKHSIKEIESIIITHYDKDHVGGAALILKQVHVKTVYVPDYDGIRPEYTNFVQAAKEKSVPIQRLKAPVSFRFVDADVLVEPPLSYFVKNPGKDYDNNFSLITTIVHGKNRLVFTGDAEKRRLREWLQGKSAVKCDFLKVPHHGVYNKALKALFETLKPEYSVICCSHKNPADSVTLALLEPNCPHIYQTKDANVSVFSDGEKITVKQKIKDTGTEVQQESAPGAAKAPQAAAE